jgi:hypothetical protein
MKTKTPLSLGKQIDDLYDLDQQIDQAQADLRSLNQLRKKKETKLLNSFEKDDIDGAKGRMGTAHITRGRHPKIKNLKEFIKYVRMNKAYELFQNRISTKAYFDRLEEGEAVPGVEIYNSFRVSIRKRKK